VNLIWLAVVDDRQCYALPTISDEERRRHRDRLGRKIIGEYADRLAAEDAIDAAMDLNPRR